MSEFKYSDEDININKVFKMNFDKSSAIQEDESRKEMDKNISSSIDLLISLGYSRDVAELKRNIQLGSIKSNLADRIVDQDWDTIVREANGYLPYPVCIEDFMTQQEIDGTFKELEEINNNFSKTTSIINKNDLSFLAIAIALQVSKSLVYPYVAQKFNYGNEIDKSRRKEHNDSSIEREHRKANDKFKDKKLKKHEAGHWINLLYQTPPYDITKGSKDLGINMGGAYHRMYTLGHDPILGWIFGTMNILTDVVTLNNFQSYRVVRDPMRITNQAISIFDMFEEGYEYIKEDYLNLPAALFAQAKHIKSDKFTKVGLPIPVLATINEGFASGLYKSNYDALCLGRDLKVIGMSAVVSRIIDIIILIVHGMFRDENEDKDLFDIRSRKILLISNTIAASSTIINASITSNPKNLDIGSLLNAVSHLFTDVRFIAKIKREFIEGEISNRIQGEISEIDALFDNK